MKRIATRQHGASGSGFIALIVLFVMLVVLVLKLFPVYMEHFNVSSSLNSLSDQADIKEMKKAEIKKLLERRFAINEVDNVNKENIMINKTKSGMTIDVIYEVRKPLVGNIDIVIYFNDQLKI